jgi:hypothetical protein
MAERTEFDFNQSYCLQDRMEDEPIRGRVVFPSWDMPMKLLRAEQILDAPLRSCRIKDHGSMIFSG